MLSSVHRFHGYGSLRYVYRNGKAVRLRELTLKYSSNPKRKAPRFSVVVSKKVLKPAVGRNRIRRRVYEILRQELPKLIENSDIILIIVSSEIRDMPHETLQGLIQNALTQANLYK